LKAASSVIAATRAISRSRRRRVLNTQGKLADSIADIDINARRPFT
jgi:hypothetical protein